MASGLNPTAAKLFRIRKTISKMLAKRAYNVSEEDTEMTPEAFSAKFGEIPSRESLNMLVMKKENPDDKLLVYFPAQDVGKKEVEIFGQRIGEMSCRRGIIVVGGRYSNIARNYLAELPGVAVESFKDEELLVDITEHELVPEHIILTDVEKANLLQRYHLKDTQLPRIQLLDPVARYYGMQRGQVVKIIRHSETAGRYVTYRVCQ